MVKVDEIMYRLRVQIQEATKLEIRVKPKTFAPPGKTTTTLPIAEVFPPLEAVRLQEATVRRLAVGDLQALQAGQVVEHLDQVVLEEDSKNA